MKAWFIAALSVQAVLMFVDEVYFHRRRGLPAWERRGHPIDTFFFMLALSELCLVGPGLGYAGLAALSTVIITKDEWQHAKLCGPMEHWLHAMLFVMHPVVLFLAWQAYGTWGLEVPALLVAVLAYQVIYWNVLYVAPDRPLAR